jgi:hypothetical protein
VSGGLVEQQDWRLLCDGAGHEDALALTAGERGEAALRHVRHGDPLERLGDESMVGIVVALQWAFMRPAPHEDDLLDA